MWLAVPVQSPNGEDKDLSQVLHLTVTPQLWAPVPGQVLAVKIHLCTQTDADTHASAAAAGTEPTPAGPTHS